MIRERVILAVIISLREIRPLLRQRSSCMVCCGKFLRDSFRYLRPRQQYWRTVGLDTDMTRSYEKSQIARRLNDLLPSEQVKHGDRVLKVAAELLERRKRFTDRENYITVCRGGC